MLAGSVPVPSVSVRSDSANEKFSCLPLLAVSGAGPRGQFGSATKGPRCRYSMAAMISAMTRMGDSAEFYGEVRNPQGDTGAELWNRREKENQAPR